MSELTGANATDIVEALERIESDTVDINTELQKIATVVTSKSPEAQARIRLGFKPTASRGWEYDSTAEVEFNPREPGAHGEALAILAQLTIETRVLGESERETRNRRDRGEAPA